MARSAHREAVGYFEQAAVGICQEADLPSVFPTAAAVLGAAYTLSGRIGDAMSLLTQAVEQSAAMERADGAARHRLLLGEAQLLAGRLEEAHALAERALALARAHQEWGHQAYALRLLGEIAARRDPPESEQLKPTTARPSPWPRSLACARSRLTATAALGNSISGWDGATMPAPSCPRRSRCTAPWT